ncbi:peptidase [Enterococcus faecium]|nr:peptidase [Enterococcus faecium]
MKEKRSSRKIPKYLFAILGMLAMALGFGLSLQSVNADNIKMEPGEKGDIYYDASNVYTMHGTKHGQPWSDATAAMAVSPNNGATDRIVFCIQPGVPFITTNNPDYEAVAVTDIPKDAQIASVIWNTFYAFGTNFTNEDRIVTQAVIWELLPQYGIKVDSISGIPDFQTKKQKLYDGIKEYKRLPEFNKKTIDLTFGETKTLTSSVDLNSFETQVSNSAKVKWDIAADGKSVDVTPTDPNVTGGSISFKRSFMEGTPIALEKTGSQTVYLPSVKDPASYSVNFKVDTNGEFQIKKVDKETGKPVPGTKFKLEYKNIPDGSTAPAPTEITTDENGLSKKIKALNGVHVKATEVFVPKPYVLGSTIGDSDVVEGDVVAGKEITLTQRNAKATGQIVVDKEGSESKDDMWNSNYTLKGNVFEVHEDTEKGKVVATITTDDKGHAETKKDLPLGTYVITEKTASNGFSNTFKPVEVKIEYKDQKTAVVVKNAKGTNQEVVGSTVLTKEDAETGKETQGRATFDGAQYGLFHKDGSPVKWSENFKPTSSKGNKLEGDEVKFELSDKEQQASVEHLALGDYYWQEIAVPEGYQLDNTKREFSITYKDQDTKVIETQSTSQENVIKFSLDGFKYVDSKSGDTKTGYNGIDFTLTPIDPTKGEQRKVTTETDENGYDGYWAFNEVPYGDYKMSEVKAPEGYNTIKDLIINSKFDAEKREYTFTITEDGQKEPVKTLTIPEAKINEGSNVIHLSKLFLTNKVKEMPTIRTKATVDGEKTFTPSKETPMQDVVSITNVENGVEYTNKIKLWRIVNDDYDNAKVVWEGSHDFVAEGDKAEDVIKQMVDTSKDDNTVSYVFTEELFIKDGAKVADHNDLTNKDQTIKPLTPGTPTIETLFVTKDGGKTFDPTKDQTLVDKVMATVPKQDIGKTFYYVTQFHKIDKNGKDTVVGTSESEHTADKESYDFDAIYAYKANTLKDGEKLVATHIAYTDKDHTKEYVKHFDLKNEKQTLTAKTPVQPVTPKTPETPKADTPKSEKTLPQTSGTLLKDGSLIILALGLIAGLTVYIKGRRKFRR